jgi:hypothetical protein
VKDMRRFIVLLVVLWGMNLCGMERETKWSTVPRQIRVKCNDSSEEYLIDRNEAGLSIAIRETLLACGDNAIIALPISKNVFHSLFSYISWISYVHMDEGGEREKIDTVIWMDVKERTNRAKKVMIRRSTKKKEDLQNCLEGAKHLNIPELIVRFNNQIRN